MSSASSPASGSSTFSSALPTGAPGGAATSGSNAPDSPVTAAPGYVKAIAPYRPGKPIGEVAREYGLDPACIIKLASNENPLGMPASARAAIQAALADLGRYPDANGFDLKAAISAKYDVPTEWITLGNGSNDGLELAARAFCAAGESIVYSQYSFIVYALSAQSIGARAIEVPALRYGHDLEAMAAGIVDDTRVVFIANPNNPTGTFVDGPRLEAFLDKVPPRVAVVLDEAYTEYLPPESRYDAMQWLRSYPNLIVSRTLSKAYGLAGLRVGFLAAQAPLTDLMNRVRQPFNVNSLAQAAAIAALNDEAFLSHSYGLNRDGLRQLEQGFARLGLEYVPSSGNFVLVRVGPADRINEKLLRAGVIVRPVGNYGLPEWLRVSVGLPEENAGLLQALEQALDEPAGGVANETSASSAGTAGQAST
jgi:histidinol-phosphate aminotransferase